MIHGITGTTPNSRKITIFLEQTTVSDCSSGSSSVAGDQFFARVSGDTLNSRIPAMIDHEPGDGAGALSVFESGAILQYLAEKSGQFLRTRPH